MREPISRAVMRSSPEARLVAEEARRVQGEGASEASGLVAQSARQILRAC